MIQSPRINAAIAIVLRDRKILICQRKAGDVFGGYWEFPGGKQEPGETLHQCLARELREELNIAADPIHAFDPIEHDYAHGQVRLHPILCRHSAGEPELIECQAARWITPSDLHHYDFPPANEMLIEQVISHLTKVDGPGESQ